MLSKSLEASKVTSAYVRNSAVSAQVTTQRAIVTGKQIAYRFLYDDFGLRDAISLICHSGSSTP